MVQFDARAPETARLLPLAPLAPPLPAPHVLDSPRTQLAAAAAANQLLLAASGASPFAPLGGGRDGGRGVLQLADGAHGAGAGAAAQGGLTVALSGGPASAPRAEAVVDGLGVLLDAQLPGLRSDAAYPWQVLTGTHPETGRAQVRGRRRPPRLFMDSHAHADAKLWRNPCASKNLTRALAIVICFLV
jgi:hypothetical protein